MYLLMTDLQLITAKHHEDRERAARVRLARRARAGRAGRAGRADRERPVRAWLRARRDRQRWTGSTSRTHPAPRSAILIE